jgi:hypothetical protein
MFAHLAMFNESPVRSHIKHYVAFGPAAFLSHTRSQLVNALLKSPLLGILDFFGAKEFMRGDTWVTS